MQFYFKIPFKTVPGQQIYVTGNTPELGHWDPLHCLMTWTDGGFPCGPVWVYSCNISSQVFEYKYVLRQGEQVLWESRENRSFNLLQSFPPTFAGHTPMILFDAWDGAQQYELSQDGLTYLLYLPPLYSVNTAGAKHPLILFLHGAGERSNHIDAITHQGIPKVCREDRSFPFVCISPVCPKTDHWRRAAMQEKLKSFVVYQCQHLAVDKERLYITGLSMGAFGGLDLVRGNPTVFAAFLSVCGGVQRGDCDFFPLAIWWVHGDADSIVDCEYSRTGHRRMQEQQLESVLTIYAGVNHDSWTRAYADPAMYTWLLAHRRTPPAKCLL